MANALTSALACHAAALKGNRGDTISYQRGASSVSLTAVVGQSETQRMDSGGTQYSFLTTDFIVQAAELILDGEVTFPQRGDKIAFDGDVYVVVSQNAGEKPYNLPENSILRIFTKMVGDS